MNMLVIAYFVVAAVDVTVTSVSVIQEDADPCLSSTLRNISHINERYEKLEDNCFYTDHKIEATWFFAGMDPIVTFPPGLCSCGYKFPIWMNGTLPSAADGVVNRIACISYTEPCYRQFIIKIKNCGKFYIYNLSPPGLDDSGYCFGIEKPEPPKWPDEQNLPKATVTIQQNATTDTSIISTIISAIEDGYNVTSELVRSDGFAIQTIVLKKTLIVYKWVNLSAATNYTIRVYVFKNGVKTELASAWAKTKAPYRQAVAHINVLQNTITKSSFSAVISFDNGSENRTGHGNIVQEDGVAVHTFPVESGSLRKSFNGLKFGTKYTIKVDINRHEESIQLAHESVFTKPEIGAFLETKLGDEMVRSFSVFKCNFNPSPESRYGVTWFVQSKERNHTIQKIAGVGEGIQQLYATEEDLVSNHVALPFHISCNVFEIPRVIKTEFSPSSTNLFAGIKVLTPTITMHRDQTATIVISPTIPFGCTSLRKTGRSSCNLTLAISVPVSKNCTGLATKQCTLTVQGSAGSRSSLQIQATEDGQYGVQTDVTHQVILRTIHVLNDSIWKDYTLPTVTVIVKPENNTYWRGKRCEALNDPHMYTFDGKRYEHHEHPSDEYVMYTHDSYTAKIHHKLEKCNTNAMCNCGVAVQAGRDIYLISTCNNIIEIGYKQCDDGVLLVKKENDYTYTIYLPFGTYVTARIDKTPYYNSVGSMIVSVSVYPSVHDQYGRSKGLCGTLDGKQSNDFHERTGQTLLNKTDFLLAWKVPKEESLFRTNTKSTSSWVHPACSCTVSNGHVTTHDRCQLGADNTCSKGKTVGEQTCKLADKISLNSFKTQTVPALDLIKHLTTKTVSVTTTTANNITVSPKSQTLTSTTPLHWNNVEATSFCTNFLNRSRAFRLCARVPYTDTDRALETCTQDILITQTTEWHKLSRQSMQDACLSEIHRNKTVRMHLEHQKKTTPSPTPPYGQHIGHLTTPKPTYPVIDSTLDINELIDVIKEIACPNECSDKGFCNNGTCKCNPGFGGDDCSIDLKQVPSTASFLHGSVCDEKEAPCTHVFIHGGLFTGETVSCHITTFETHAYKDGRQNLDAYVIRGEAQSLIEVTCPLDTNVRRRRSVPAQDVKLLSCYSVAVSNDGIHHGSPIAMCVYNSKCQSLFNDANGLLTAKIKRGFCYIDGNCVLSNERKPSSETYCLPPSSLYSWSELPNSTETFSTVKPSEPSILISRNSDNNWNMYVIVAAVCVCCVCVIIGMVVYIRKRKQREIGEKNKEKEELELSNKHDADFNEETYAHINPTDVSDHVSHTIKNFNPESDVTNDYSRLDMTKREEKFQYAKLNSTQNIRSENNRPMLPERPSANPENPYEKLQTENKEKRDYERMKNITPNLYQNGRPSVPYRDSYCSAEKRNTYLKPEKNRASNLVPKEGFDESSLEVRRHPIERGQRNDDVMEGYERPDPVYRRY